METVGNSRLWTFLDGEEHATDKVSNQRIRNGLGHPVGSYLELARKVSELQFRNRDSVFLFRGQSRDFKNRVGNSSLRPSLLRQSDVRGCFATLLEAERLLVSSYTFKGAERLRKHQALRWAILQHYEVCATPLLDVTQSLRIATSFASETAVEEGFIFVLGVPNISGAITASDEAGLEVIRLSSVCPPEAVRAHVQEGYLLSEYPELSSPTQKNYYENHELDFGKRVVAKFRFDPVGFWEANPAFPMIPRSALYPQAPYDPLLALADEIKRQLGSYS